MPDIIMRVFSVLVPVAVAMATSPAISRDCEMSVMQDVTVPVEFSDVALPQGGADGNEGSGADPSPVTEAQGDDAIPKAWTQERKGVDETHIDAWNKGNVDGHPDSEQWFHDEQEYVAEMLGKAMAYDSDTDWVATVDTDLCRVTFFHRDGGTWVPKCGWNTYQGIHRPWQDEEWDGGESETKRNWSGPRSRSFKGAWKISGRWPDGGGVCEWATSIVPCDHELGAVRKDNCQRFETSYGDASGTPLEKRFKTHGCTGLDTPCAKWVCETIPNSTTVVVFDKVNPWPEWFQGDGSPS